MDTESKHFHIVNENLRLIVKDMKLKREGMQQEMKESITKIKEQHDYMQQFKDEVYEVLNNHLNDYKKLKKGIKRLHRIYVLAEANKKEGAEIVELGTIVLPESEYIYDFSFPEDEGKPNPHLWTDPRYAIAYAEVIAETLQRRDPANADYYAENLSAFRVKAVTGETLELEPLLAKGPVLIDFWATWCAPCREEMPSIAALSEAFPAEDFAVITIATGRNPAPAIEKFLSEIGLEDMPVYTDLKQRLAREMGVMGLPVSILIDREGREVARLTGGADWNSDSAHAIIAAMIGEEG